MTITDERRQSYDFSDSYFESGIQIAKEGNDSINSYEDLDGKTVGAKVGTESDFLIANEENMAIRSNIMMQPINYMRLLTADKSMP